MYIKGAKENSKCRDLRASVMYQKQSIEFSGTANLLKFPK